MGLLVFPDLFPVLEEELVEIGVFLVQLPVQWRQLFGGFC